MLPAHQMLCCRLDERRLERVNSLALDDLDAEGHHIDVAPDEGVLPLGPHLVGLCCIIELPTRCVGVPHVAVVHLDVLYAPDQLAAAGRSCLQLYGISPRGFPLCKTAVHRQEVAPATHSSMPCRLRAPSCGVGG